MRKVASLIEHHAEVWQRATHHPFLDDVRSGSLPASAFAVWLAQDYLYAGDLLRCQARLLNRAPRSAHAVLVRGLVALEDELSWFEGQSAQRGLTLAVAHHPTTAAYRHFLYGLDTRSFAAATAALWAMERAYLDAWRTASPGHPDYRAFIERWTTRQFGEYVVGLERVADAAAVPGEENDVEAAFVEVATLEHAFWEMAWSGR